MPTIREVARLANVSPTTVSHVLNNTRRVSPDVRDRVLRVVQSIHYQPNALARSLRRGETHTLGLVLPDSANPFFAEIGRSIEAAAFQSGFSVILCNSESNPEKEMFYLDVMARKRVDGILLVSAGISPAHLEEFRSRGIPVVAMDRDFAGLDIDTVLSDNQYGAVLATRHLMALGHRRIACITGPSGISPSAQRATGYARALEEARLPIDPNLVVRGDFRPESGWRAARTLFSLKSPPDAIFACNDMMAIGVLRAASELGLRIPVDAALVGFDDIELSAYTHPALTTVSQDKTGLAATAVQFLVERITSDNRLELRRALLQPRLVVRRSCGGNP